MSQYLETRFLIKSKVKNIKMGGEGPGRRFGHTFEVIPNSNKLVLIGGSFKDPSIYVFDFVANTWEKKQGFIGFRYHSSCVLRPSDSPLPLVLVFGGKVGGKSLSDVHELATDSYYLDTLEIEEKPVRRWRHTMVASPFDPDEAYVYAGRSGIRCLNDIWKFNRKDKKWTLITTGQARKLTNPPNRYAHSALMFNFKMLVCGGKNIKGVMNDFWEFDFSTNLWTEIKVEHQDYIVPRFLHSMILMNDSNEILFGTGYYDESLDFTTVTKKQLSSFLILNYKDKIFTNTIQFDKSNANKIFYDYSLVQFQENKIFLFGGDLRPGPKKMKGEYRALQNLEMKNLLTFDIPPKLISKRIVPEMPTPAPPRDDEDDEPEEPEEVEGEEEEINQEGAPNADGAPGGAVVEGAPQVEGEPKVEVAPVQPQPAVGSEPEKKNVNGL